MGKEDQKLKPLFWLITPSDFARSIAWAKKQPPNPITEALKKHGTPRKP